jgi:hypothetical protein
MGPVLAAYQAMRGVSFAVALTFWPKSVTCAVSKTPAN